MYQIIAGMVSRVGSITAIYAKSAVNALSRVLNTIFFTQIYHQSVLKQAYQLGMNHGMNHNMILNVLE